MKEDPLTNFWVIASWGREEVLAWASLVVSKEDRPKLAGITGQQLLRNEYPALSLKSQTSVQQRMRKWQTDAKNNEPLISWVKTNTNATNRSNWLRTMLLNGVLSAMREMGDSLIFQHCDPPIGDGQCQCRAAQNALTLHHILTNPTVQKKWQDLQNQLTTIGSAPETEIVSKLSNLFADNQWLMDSDLAAIWHLIKCHIVTLGKITLQTTSTASATTVASATIASATTASATTASAKSGTKHEQSSAQLSTMMSTDRQVLAQSLQISNLDAVDHLLFVLRDQISKESVRFLRHHIRNQIASNASIPILPWWCAKQSGELCGIQWTATVRGWPSVPMFWSYASLLRILWDQIPIIAKVRHLNKDDGNYSVVHLNRHVIHSPTAWVIEGCSQLSLDQAKDVSVHEWVELVLMSVADHPQYPIESNSPEYKKAQLADVKTILLPEHRRLTTLKGVEITQEIALEEMFRAKMMTEHPQHAAALQPYPKYRDDAAHHGCTVYNPIKFLVQHVYPNSVAIALADPYHHLHHNLSTSLLLLIHNLL